MARVKRCIDCRWAWVEPDLEGLRCGARRYQKVNPAWFRCFKFNPILPGEIPRFIREKREGERAACGPKSERRGRR